MYFGCLIEKTETHILVGLLFLCTLDQHESNMAILVSTYPLPSLRPSPQQRHHLRQHHQQLEQRHHRNHQMGQRPTWKNPQRSTMYLSDSSHSPLLCVCPYLVDVLALELLEKGIETLIIGLDSDRLENGLDVLGRWGGVTTEGEEKVSCEVLHFGSWELSVAILCWAAQASQVAYICLDFWKNRRFNRFNRSIGRRLKRQVQLVV